MDFAYFIGIDPGMTGAIVAVDRDGAIANMLKFDAINPLDAVKLLLCSLGIGQVSVALEKVGARPGQDAGSLFKFAEGYGALQGYLCAHEVGVQLYTPQEWQKYLPPSGSPKGRVLAYLDHKGVRDAFIWEGCRVPHQGCADAFAIADYHRMIKLESLVRPKNATRPPKKRLKPLRF